MLTIAEHKDSEGVKKYFKEHLGKGDYYTEKDNVQGKWFGKTPEHLGIDTAENSVLEKDFNALSDGVHPKTKKKITVRQKSDRTICYDMVFSAPKSVSIMALICQDRRILEAHEKSVALAFTEMEKRAKTRVRKGLSIQSKESRVTGNLVSAQFTHTSNRELDPQLHSHHVVFNATFDPVEKRLKALDAFDIYTSTPFITEVYRNALAQEVRSLGYEIEPGRYTWRIKGIPLEVEHLFSKRAQQIDKAAEKLIRETGIEVDKRGRAILSLNTRKKKVKDLQEEALHHHQVTQLTPSLLNTLETVRERVESYSGRHQRSIATTQSQKEKLSPLQTKDLPPLEQSPAHEIINYALDHVFARKSVVKQDVLLEAALKHSAGRVSYADLLRELESNRFLKRGGDIMTREERKREVDLIEFIRNGKRLYPELGNPENLAETLTLEQKAAIQKLLQSKDQILYLRGAAGVGKTFTLKELVQHTSMPVTITAPTSGATDKLREDGFQSALTVQKLLKDGKESKIENSLLVVDEAGLLSTKQMESLFLLAKETDSRVLLIGDTLQHNSVESGDALRLIENYSVVTQAEIGTINRQTERDYREAVQALSQGEISKGIQKLEKLKAFHELDDEKRPKAVATEYVNHLKNGVKALIVTPTWNEHERITQAVRQELKQAGLIHQEERKLATYRSLNFTTVQKTYAPNFTPGDYVSFHLTSGEFKQGENWRVESVRDQFTVTLSNDLRERKDLIPKQHYRAFDVVNREEATFSAGDLLLMKANYASSPSNRIPNGSIRKIDRIDTDGSIHLEGGKKLDPNFRHFTHGYAVTSQASQGKDATHVIVSIDVKTKAALSKNQFYVSSSRGKRGISIYTASKQALAEGINRSSSRKLALERIVREGILKNRLIKLQVRYQRSVDMSRDLLERAFVKFRREKARAVIRTHRLEKSSAFERTH